MFDRANYVCRVCSPNHDFLQVPPLKEDQKFKEDEMLVNEKVMKVEDFKKAIKQQYGLK